MAGGGVPAWNQALTERAKGLISDFAGANTAQRRISATLPRLASPYTTVTDDEIPVQVNIDLVNYQLGAIWTTSIWRPGSTALCKLISNELENLDFSDLIHVSDEDVGSTAGTRRRKQLPPAENRSPYSAEAILRVYLENGKPLYYREHRRLDITLRDPTLFYPISRAEAGRTSRGSWSGISNRKRPPQRIRLSLAPHLHRGNRGVCIPVTK